MTKIKNRIYHLCYFHFFPDGHSSLGVVIGKPQANVTLVVNNDWERARQYFKKCFLQFLTSHNTFTTTFNLSTITFSISAMDLPFTRVRSDGSQLSQWFPKHNFSLTTIKIRDFYSTTSRVRPKQFSPQPVNTKST